MWEEKLVESVKQGAGRPIVICHECGESSDSAPDCGHIGSFYLYLLVPIEKLSDVPGKGEESIPVSELKKLFVKQGSKSGESRVP